jgi:VCBS repeat-containing protein
LADNNGDHLFAYLIIVRTGIGYKSGTSSNVTITVTGDKDSSAVGTNTFDQLFSNDTFAAARVELPRP